MVAALLLLGSVAVAGSSDDAVVQRLKRIHPLAEQYSVEGETGRLKPEPPGSS